MVETVSINAVTPNEDNPRILKDDKFKKLVKSIKEFPEMLQIRPIVVNADNIVLGGNMRLEACKKAGLKEVTILKAEHLTKEQQKEFIIKDNVGFGEWDWDMIANEWDVEQIEEWGLDIPIYDKVEDLEEGETIHVDKSLQVLPKKEYLIIYAEEDSEEWEDLKTIFKCKTVRQGGCKIGSTSDKATTGLERVFSVESFKNRVLNGL